MTDSDRKKISVAVLIMTASVFLSRVIGLFREMTIAWAGGIKGDVDAYLVAFIIPEILNHIVAGGFLSITFIPIFTKYLKEGRESEGWNVFSVILSVFGTFLLLFITAGCILAPWIVPHVAPGIKDPVILDRAVRMTRIILPAQFFFFTGGLFMAVQYSMKRFSIPAMAPLIYNLGIITGGVLLGPKIGMTGFSWGVLFGAFVGNFAIQLWGARRAGMRFRFRFDLRHKDLLRYIKLTLPLMVGLTMTFSTEFFLKYFGSMLPEGSIASLNFGLRVMLILVGLFGQAVGVAAFPFMASLAGEEKIGEMNKLMNGALRYMALIIPISIFIIVLRHEVIQILFQRGKFDAAATAQTSHVLIFLMIGAFAVAAQTIVVRSYYAMQNTLFPALYGTIAVVVSIPFYITGLKFFGISGVGLAISISACIQFIFLYIIWNRKTGNRESSEVYRFFLKMTGIGIAILFLLEPLRSAILTRIIPNSPLGSILVVIITGVLFIILLILAGYLFHIPEIPAAIRNVTRKINRGNSK